jgi:iron complex outermembrane recepter protein
VGVAVTYIDKEYGLPDDIDDPDTEIDLVMERLTVQGRGEWLMDGFFKNVELRLNGARYAHQEIEAIREGEIVNRDIELDFLQYSVSNTLTLVHNPFLIFSEGAVGLSVLYRDMSVGGFEALSPDGRSIAMGIFVFEEIPLTDYLRLQFGSRVEAHRITARANDKFPEAGSTRESTTISGSAGFNYRPHYRFEVGLQAARAHRTPALEELYSDAAHLGTGAYEIGNPGLRNEIGHGVDIFGKYTGGTIQLEAAGFYNRISDFIFLEPTGAVHTGSGLPIFQYIASDAGLFGGEAGGAAVIPLGGVADVFQGEDQTGGRRYSIKIDVQASYVRGTRLDSERTPLPFMPPLRGRMGMILDAGSWWIGGSVYWTSAQNRVAPDEGRTDAYTLVNGEAGYRLHYSGRHVLSIRMDNIFNTVYRDHLSRVQDRDNPMPGRNVHAMYRWYF